MATKTERKVIEAARKLIEAWRHPQVWENDRLYDRIRDLEVTFEGKKRVPRHSFEVGDVIVYVAPPKYRVDAIRRVHGVDEADLTMIEDHLGNAGEWRQQGGPCSLEGAVVIEEEPS